jgi:serine protease
MSDLDAVFASLKAAPLADPEDALIIELVLPQPKTESDLFNQIRRRLSHARIELKEVFAAAGQPDRFFFLTLPEVRAAGREGAVFEFARQLGASLGAIEANPCLQEGLTYGSELDQGEITRLGTKVFGPGQTGLGKGWAPNLIEADKVWAITRGEGVKIAQIDTGHSSHNELRGIYATDDQLNLIETGSPEDASDRFSRNVWFPHPGHGTYGASVMASRGGLSGDNALEPGQITGVAPASRVVPIRAIRSVIDLNQTRIPTAIRHAVKSECDVIAMCLGGISHTASVQKAMRDAVDNGLIIVCAAGNVWPWVVFPAAYSVDRLCAAVAAIDQKLRPWTWTARGSAVTVSAPGKDVWAARKNSTTDEDHVVDACEGTTLACSLTAGIAALFVAKNGGRARLREIARKAGLTVQDLFLRAIVHNISPPAQWRGSTNLGAGVVDARTTLDFDPAQVRLRPMLDKIEDAQPEFISAADVLRRMAGSKSQLAALEVDQAIEPYAQELIWRHYVSGARDMVDRLAAQPGVEKLSAPVRRKSPPNEDIVRLLSERPHLASAMDL